MTLEEFRQITKILDKDTKIQIMYKDLEDYDFPDEGLIETYITNVEINYNREEKTITIAQKEAQ